MTEDLRQMASVEAEVQGFSSLQELVRVMLSQVARKQMRVGFGQAVPLSWESEKRYMKMTEDRKRGVNWKSADSVDVFLKQLDEN